MVKDILKEWEHLDPFCNKSLQAFRDMAQDALNEIASKQVKTYQEVDSKLLESLQNQDLLLLSKFSDCAAFAASTPIKVRIPVSPDEGA